MDFEEGSTSQQLTQTQSNESKRGRNWTEDEDAQLCLSWLAISKDSVKGTDQSKTTFWMAVRQHAGIKMYYIKDRPVDGVRQRFNQLSHQISKYIGCLAFVNRANKSGESTDDKYQAARELFLRETKQRHFKIQRCYDILKTEPKFQVASANKRMRSVDDVPFNCRRCCL
ncbi:uncharacterized protein LOC134224117 isoform X2 [Armigeres subalbatus]|uniref:uncharacterized protein LOC134224117 isoform X2 n=1 Tax=Armigeres subalbatus TaxID=124917 RepID=UPI002ED56975